MKKLICVFESCRVRIRQDSDVRFARFVKPLTDLKRAIHWIKLVGRSDLRIEHIDRWTVICEKHFPKNVELDWRKNKLLEPFPETKKKEVEPDLRLCRQENVKTYESKSRCVKVMTIPVGHAVSMNKDLSSIDYKSKFFLARPLVTSIHAQIVHCTHELAFSEC